MSAPDATVTRRRSQRATVSDDDGKDSTDPQQLNPTSLGTGSDKNIRRKTPKVNPPFLNTSMNQFLTYLTLGLALVAVFYAWRFTVWASQAGGYWNLITGKRAAQAVNPNAGGGVGNAAGAIGNEAMVKSAAKSAASAASAVSSGAKKGKGGKAQPAAGNTDVQSQIFTLATALGVTPHDLTAAIRPLIDPSVPNPIEAATKEIEMLKLQLQGLSAGGAATQAQAQEKVEEKPSEGSLLGIVSEVLLD